MATDDGISGSHEGKRWRVGPIRSVLVGLRDVLIPAVLVGGLIQWITGNAIAAGVGFWAVCVILTAIALWAGR